MPDEDEGHTGSCMSVSFTRNVPVVSFTSKQPLLKNWDPPLLEKTKLIRENGGEEKKKCSRRSNAIFENRAVGKYGSLGRKNEANLQFHECCFVRSPLWDYSLQYISSLKKMIWFPEPTAAYICTLTRAVYCIMHLLQDLFSLCVLSISSRYLRKRAAVCSLK